MACKVAKLHEMGEMYTDAEGQERGEVTGFWVEDDYYLFQQFR